MVSAQKGFDWAQPGINELLQAAPDAMLIVNSEGNIVAVNSQVELMFGYSREELIRQKVEILIPSRYGQSHVKHRSSFLNENRTRPMGAGETLFAKRKHGAEFPVEISLSPVRTAQGLFVISAVRDVTARKNAEDRIKQLNAELGSALRRAEQLGPTGDLAANMARSIETVLDKLIRQIIQIERLSSTQPTVQELIPSLKESVEEIGTITRDVIGLKQEHDSWKKR